MDTTESAPVEAPIPQQVPTGRIVFTQGGKGGVGKTAFTSLLVEWYARQGLRYTLLDLDTENKARGSLTHFFPEARKVNIHTSEGLDAFVDVLDHAPLVVADMGAGAGQVAAEWFEAMAESVCEMGVTFTAIGVVTPDPASVESVCAWADALQDRVSYLIVKNSLTSPANFSYWDDSRQARSFREALNPEVIAMEYRLPKVENPARQHGLTMNRIADRRTEVPELQQTTVVMRAQAYRRNLFTELDRVKDLLL
jgi:Mrp family chromosome partitioning ATPase